VLLSHHHTIQSIGIVSIIGALAIGILGEEGAKLWLPRVDVVSYIIDDLIHLGLIVYISDLNFGLIDVVLTSNHNALKAQK
jgi:hypothetical protein